ncbi:MAG TPA: MFS transporter [Steroidobacteraceae bacterium]|jgi:AAHS family 4-hydroxybenzoate transporter-like MFS transporter|nr:MFS transporter [Steroidobacteraceae bacterium]
MPQTLRIDDLVDGQKFSGFNFNLLFWSFLAMFADGYDISVMPFAMPTLSKMWHVDAGLQGWVLTTSLIGVLAGSPLLGYVGDRYGRKAAILCGSVIYGVSTLAVIWQHGLWVTMALRFCTGIGIGGLMPNTIALNSEASPKRLRATLVVLMFTGITLGSSAPGYISAWMLPIYGWTVLFLVGGAVPLLVAVCLYFVLPESVKFLGGRPERRAQLLATARRMRPDLLLDDDTQFEYPIIVRPPDRTLGIGEVLGPGFRAITPLLWVCFVTTLMANYFLNSWMPLLFNEAGLAPKQAALASSLYHIGGTVGGLLISVLLDRFGFVVIAALFVCAAPAIDAIGGASMSYAALAPLAALSGLCVLGAQFGNNAAAGLLYPTQFRSKGVGWALGIGRFGAIVGPLLGGQLIKTHLPMRQLFLAASAPMWIGAVAALILVRLCYVRLGRLQLSDVPVTR